MATPMVRAAKVEPSTDFPTLDLVPPDPAHDRSRWMTAIVLAVAGAILVGSIGFAIGRATAPVPAGCATAIELANRAVTEATAGLRTTQEGMRIFLDGELPEASSLLDHATLSVGQLAGIRTAMTAAAESCLGA